MKCVWSPLIAVLPIWMRHEVDKIGKERLLEIRMRLGLPPELIMVGEPVTLNRNISKDDLNFCVNVASQYSPWASVTAAKGYITIEGGHRIGISGRVTHRTDKLSGFHQVSSLCIRVAREFPGICANLWKQDASILIVGRPGSGKTTLLRDLITQKSNQGRETICVIDEKCELFPYCNSEVFFSPGIRSDVISECSKAEGIEMAIRNMNPQVIAVDEITAAEDCNAMLQAGWCGVKLIATAHAGTREDLYKRPLYRPIIQSDLFNLLVIMQPDRSWTAERMK